MIDRLISTKTVMRGFLNCLEVSSVFLVALLSRTDVVVESKASTVLLNNAVEGKEGCL